MLGHAAQMIRPALFIQRIDLQPAVIQRIARRPNDRGDPRLRQIQPQRMGIGARRLYRAGDLSEEVTGTAALNPFHWQTTPQGAIR